MHKLIYSLIIFTAMIFGGFFTIFAIGSQ